MTGTIFDLQRGSFVDGPGVRTTVFLKGCNLRCAWCHNPEGWLKEQQILYYASKCSHCGRCERVCRHTAIHTPSRCVLCGACVDACLNNARELCGRNISTDELMTDLRKDDAFFQISGGGVTFSGGECMLQIDFLAEMLHLCTSEGINTAVDTAGSVPYGMFQRVMDTTNLFLYDVKCVSPGLHWKFTGVDNALILENLRRLSCDHAQIWVRVPIIGGFNDNADELKRIAEFVNKCEVARVDLLPYHKMGLSKYEAVWRKTGPQFMTPDSTLLSQAASWFRNVSMNQGGKNEREKKTQKLC